MPRRTPLLIAVTLAFAAIPVCGGAALLGGEALVEHGIVQGSWHWDRVPLPLLALLPALFGVWVAVVVAIGLSPSTTEADGD